MKRFVAAIIVIVMTANPALACVELRERPVTDDDFDRLALYLDENFDKVSSATPIRKLSSRSRGSGPYFSVDIHFEPHETIGGIESFYGLTCQYNPDVGFDCGSLDTLHSLSFDDPDDYVRIDSAFPTQIGRNIVASIRDAILVDSAGHYKFHEWGEEQISDAALNLLRIESTDIGLYKVYANSDASCSYHIIEVREVECGLEHCSFEILRNEVVNFL